MRRTLIRNITMRTIKWNSDLAVGIDEIDEDHRKLITYLNDLFAACFAAQGPAVLKGTLEAMQRYTREHFSHEEDVMRKVGYPGLEEHRAQHAELISELDDLVDEFEHGADHGLSNKTLQFLEDWLLHHILIEDRKIGRHTGAID